MEVVIFIISSIGIMLNHENLFFFSFLKEYKETIFDCVLPIKNKIKIKNYSGRIYGERLNWTWLKRCKDVDESLFRTKLYDARWL